jgi:ribonucleoside-diphosphate reductase alpha chain
MDGYQQYIAKSRYARYLPEEQRREDWPETVHRYLGFFLDRGQIDQDTYEWLFGLIHGLDVMPSMRCLMTAGEALDRDNVAGFNCSYLPIDHPRAFDELMYILLCGTGVGYSVERQYISKLPEVAEDFNETDTTIVVADSKIGWAKAVRQIISLLYVGEVPKWDLSGVRPAGSVLKTFGGRASGPEPLDRLLTFITEVFRKAKGRRLSSIEVHDVVCKIAESVVVGGVRRSALISLSNPSDGRLRSAKSGQWWLDNPQRSLANNSACYTERPEYDFFYNEMGSLYESKSGERGVFSRVAAQKIAARNGRREGDHDFGTNPCSEIILRPNQFCNLSEVVIRPEDTFESLQEKVKAATILGTLQASLTDFRYLRPIWKRNTEEEALLGVSFTGIMDHKVMSGMGYRSKGESEQQLTQWLNKLREVAIETNKDWSSRIGVNQSTAITCVKPSGTVSQLCNSSSGIHPRLYPYYIRRVRADDKDPLGKVLIDAGIPYEKDNFQDGTLVFDFPQESPEHAVVQQDIGAMEQLRIWKLYQDHWCEHKPSITVYYRDEEFFDIASWMWKNFDYVSGISLLPYSDHTYAQAPYEEITEEQYREYLAWFPQEFDWDIKEEQDVTEGSQELACVGTSCEL